MKLFDRGAIEASIKDLSTFLEQFDGTEFRDEELIVLHEAKDEALDLAIALHKEIKLREL